MMKTTISKENNKSMKKVNKNLMIKAKNLNQSIKNQWILRQ